MKLIEKAYQKKQDKGWDILYWAIDLHDTVFPGHYSNDDPIILYPFAKEVLQALTGREDTRLIAFTSSYFYVFGQINKWLWDNHKIKFDYINGNPECKNTTYASFNHKFYFNILLDDKAGFDGEKDWIEIYRTLTKLGVIE